MAESSIYTFIVFVLTTLITLWFFLKATKNSKVILAIMIWMVLVGILGFLGFYRNTEAIPPRFLFLLGPGFLFVLLPFLFPSGRRFMDTLDLKWLTLLHTVRIPVEFVLYFIFLEGLIPKLMTFEGFNYDILSGTTAPLIYFAVFLKSWMGKKGLLLWNILCLILLFNILTIALLSAETPFQKLAFDQPNIGVAYFPYVWLPTVIVPIVLFSHLVAIRQLLSYQEKL